MLGLQTSDSTIDETHIPFWADVFIIVVIVVVVVIVIIVIVIVVVIVRQIGPLLTVQHKAAALVLGARVFHNVQSQMATQNRQHFVFLLS